MDLLSYRALKHIQSLRESTTLRVQTLHKLIPNNILFRLVEKRLASLSLPAPVQQVESARGKEDVVLGAF